MDQNVGTESVSRPDSKPELKHQVEWFIARAAIATLTRLSPIAASNLGGYLFKTFGPLLPVTRIADANLRLAFPSLDRPARQRIVRGMWENLGRTAGEFPHLPGLRENTRSGSGWDVVNKHILLEQAQNGGPAIFMSGHIGNWEMLPAAVATYGMPFSSVYRPASNPVVDALIQGLRRRAMGCDVPMFPKGQRGARNALAHLHRGGYLGMLVDQKMNDGIEAQLFGIPAMTAPALAALALRFRCPVIPGYVERVGPARLRLTVEEPLTLPDSGDRQADIMTLTQTMNDCLERWIRQEPQNWLWLHRRFPKALVKARTGMG